MRVDKVILKAFISTFSAIVLLLALMFSALALVFPSTMMHISYDFGWDRTSIRYAQRAYGWFEDTSYMAYAFEVAIGCGNQEKIEECGLLLVEDEEYFAQYCAEKGAKMPSTLTGDYEDFIYGKIAVAKYEQGAKEEAVNYAFDTLQGGFPMDNAAVAVLYAAASKGDKATMDMIKGKMEQQQASIADRDKAYFGKVLAVISE